MIVLKNLNNSDFIDVVYLYINQVDGIILVTIHWD